MPEIQQRHLTERSKKSAEINFEEAKRKIIYQKDSVIQLDTLNIKKALLLKIPLNLIFQSWLKLRIIIFFTPKDRLVRDQIILLSSINWENICLILQGEGVDQMKSKIFCL